MVLLDGMRPVWIKRKKKGEKVNSKEMKFLHLQPELYLTLSPTEITDIFISH